MYIDFVLYDNISDAKADVNAWKFCNYDDPGVGFPRDCGVKGYVPYQWNAINRNSAVKKFRFSMEYEKNKWVTLYQIKELINETVSPPPTTE